MKKQVKRFLCFFMCFCLCFAWFGEPMEANASGGALLGVLITFMIGSGIGFAISGASQVFSDGMMGYVDEFINHGHENFWEAIEAGVTISEAGVLLLDKVATDALNSFMNWLQTDKGWTEGEEIDIDSISYYAIPYVTHLADGSTFSGEISDFSSLRFSFDELFVQRNVTSGTYFTVDSDFDIYFFASSSTDPTIAARTLNSSGVSTNKQTCSLNECLVNSGYTLSDVVGYEVEFSYNADFYEPRIKCYVLTSDGNSLLLCGVSLRNYNDAVELHASVASANVGSVSYPDTSDWDDATSLGLFRGHSGKIPTSVEEYNDLVLQDINSGVIPEVTTDVIVGTPDQVLPDEEDGTLSGTVSGILAQVKALPQTLANLILDGIKSIFIPDPEHLETQFMGLLEEVNDVYEFDFDLEGLFSVEGKPPEDIKASYIVGDESIEMTFVSWRHLIFAVGSLRKYIRGFIIVLLAFFQLRQFMSVLNMVSLESGAAAPAGESSTSVVVYKGR